MGHCLACVHWTHIPTSTAQYGVGAMQLLSLVHCTHRPFMEQ